MDGNENIKIMAIYTYASLSMNGRFVNIFNPDTILKTEIHEIPGDEFEEEDHKWIKIMRLLREDNVEKYYKAVMKNGVLSVDMSLVFNASIKLQRKIVDYFSENFLDKELSAKVEENIGEDSNDTYKIIVFPIEEYEAKYFYDNRKKVSPYELARVVAEIAQNHIAFIRFDLVTYCDGPMGELFSSSLDEGVPTMNNNLINLPELFQALMTSESVVDHDWYASVYGASFLHPVFVSTIVKSGYMGYAHVEDDEDTKENVIKKCNLSLIFDRMDRFDFDRIRFNTKNTHVFNALRLRVTSLDGSTHRDEITDIGDSFVTNTSLCRLTNQEVIEILDCDIDSERAKFDIDIT